MGEAVPIRKEKPQWMQDRDERALELIQKLPGRDKTAELSTAAANKLLLQILETAPDAIPLRLVAKLLDSVHQIAQLERGEPTTITREAAEATVAELRGVAEARKQAKSAG